MTDPKEPIDPIDPTVPVPPAETDAGNGNPPTKPPIKNPG